MLRDCRTADPSTYLSIAVAGFPNLFMITGQQSPAVVSNVPVSIKQHVAWISDLLDHARTLGVRIVDATRQSEDEWGEQVGQAASRTARRRAASWYKCAYIACGVADLVTQRVVDPDSGSIGGPGPEHAIRHYLEREPARQLSPGGPFRTSGRAH